MSGSQRAQQAEELGRKALAAYDAGDYVAAADFADQAFRNRSDQPEATITYALLLKDRDPRQALDLVKKYTDDRGKRDYRGYEVGGDIYMKSNSPGQAANFYLQALQWSDNIVSKRAVKAEIRMKLAEAQSMRQLCKDAVSNAEQAVRGLQQTADLQWRMARVYNKCGKSAESAAAMELAVKLLRGEIEGMKRDELRQFNELYSRLTMRDEILRAQYKVLNEKLEKLTGEKKGTGEVRMSMARAMVEQAENDRMIKLTRAAGLVQDAVQQDEKRIEYYLLLAEIEEAIGFRASAVAALLKARAVNPSDARVSEALRRLNPGAASASGGGAGVSSPIPASQPARPTSAPAGKP